MLKMPAMKSHSAVAVFTSKLGCAITDGFGDSYCHPLESLLTIAEEQLLDLTVVEFLSCHHESSSYLVRRTFCDPSLCCLDRSCSSQAAARSTARSGSLISRKAIAIVAPPVSNSTTAVEVIAIALMSTSEPANGVARAQRDRNARARPSVVLPFTCMSRFGNGHV